MFRYVISMHGTGLLVITGKTWNFSQSMANVKYWKYKHEALKYMKENRIKEYYEFAEVVEINFI